MNITQSITNTTVTTNSFNQTTGGYWRWQLILTPNTNYYFDREKNGGDYTATVTYPSGYINNITGRILSDGTLLFQFDFTSQTTAQNSNCVVNGNVFTDTTTISITENLTQCTLSGLPSNIYSDTVLNLTLTANQNYHFTTAPTLILTDSNSITTTLNFTISANTLTATINCNLANYQNIESININGVAVLLPANTIPIIQNLLNCSSNAPQNVSEYDNTITITLTANNNYLFTNENIPYVNFHDEDDLPISDLDGNSYYNFTITNNGLNATLNLNVSRLNWNYTAKIELNATAISETPTPETVSIHTNISNAILTGLPQVVYTDTVLNLTLTANNGYEFATVPNVSILDGNGIPQIKYFTLAADKLSGSITLDLGNYVDMQSGHVTITANATAITPYVDKYGTINVYKVTTQNLSDFAALRFIKEKENPSDTSGYFQLIDLGDYVVSVKRFYCPITDVLTAYIKAGNYNTNIQTETPQNDNFVIDCGTVTIPNKNNSITDYQTDIKIFLPFVGFVSVPSDYVGKTLTLKYKVNIITGDSLALLTCNGIEVDFIQCTVSNDIIFKTNKENVFGGNAEFNLQVLKGLQPYAVIKYFTDENKQIYNADCKRVLLSEISGYFVVSELTNFAANITETENQMLLNELSNGVIILGF